jgi:hypothetical protein
VLGALIVVLVLAAAGEREPARADPVPSRDWMRSLYAVAGLSTRPASTPVVLLLGGSAARESTIGNSNWRDQIARRGGPPVVALTLASRNQSFAQDLHLVRGLPDGPTLVFVGVNLYRFCASPLQQFVMDPGPFARESAHRYSRDHLLSAERKDEIAAQWMRKHYRKFAERFVFNVGVLEEVVRTCLERGMHPVILDLPRNVAVIGDRLNVPIEAYSRACLELSARYHVPFISYVTGADLQSSDFYDNAHLVEPGRAKWQSRLSNATVDLLREYGMTAFDPQPSPGADGAGANGEAGDWVVSPWSSLPAFVPRGEPQLD